MNQKKVVHVSTFKPEECGIASWTQDVIDYSIHEDPYLINRVVAMNVSRRPEEYPDFVDFCIEKERIEDYIDAAEFLNSDEGTDLVSIQHEFGIFGGNQGDYLIEFLDRLKKPSLLTCHTVPRQQETDRKSRERREVLSRILPRVTSIMAISQTATNILQTEYKIKPEKISKIYHGTHDFSESRDEAKKIIGNLEDRFVISTVGLVRPKRGMEKVIHALPDVVKKHPHMLYHIAGKTHPKKLINGNDPYRKMLQEETRRLGLEDNIRFTNHYLPLNSLLRNIRASDLGITPYSNVGQISSGVLSYYLGLGVPVISTPFLYAQEVLADGRGIILPELDNSDAITDTLLDVLDNPKKLEQMKANMAPFTEQMRWPNVAKQYVKEERKLIKT